jgi:hypothetical protein
MPAQINNDGSLAITAMSLVEFLPLIVKGIEDGFVINLDMNEGVPQMLGSLLVLTMYKKTVKAGGYSPEVRVPSTSITDKIDGRRKKI